MTTERCIQRTIENLRATIAHHEQQYRIRLEPEITDSQFDVLKTQLALLETQYPQYAVPATVGSDLQAGRPSIVHTYPMLSLDHTSDLDRVATFADAFHATGPLSVEPKLDGMALSLRYVDGSLISAATRGNGIEGESCLKQIATLHSVPPQLSFGAAGLIEVRGEVIVDRAVFDAYNEEAALTGSRTYTNPRAMAAAAMRILDISVMARLKVRFIAYEVYGLGVASLIEAHTQLQQWGFVTIKARYHIKTAGVLKHIQAIADSRAQFAYDIDGAVIKLTNLSARQRLGETAAHPRWAIAFKYPAQEAFAPIEAVVFQTGRTGAITPVVKVTPTALGDITVKSVTLHNPATLTRMAIKLGDIAVIRRANDVIPYFVKALPRGEGPLVAAPTTCASCGATLTSFGSSGLRCTNAMACPAQSITTLIHFAGKTALDIDGLGKERLKALWEAKVVTTPADLYRLTMSQVRQVLSLQPQYATKLLVAIGASKFTTLPRLLVGLGIPGIGRSMAVEVAKTFHYDAMAIFHGTVQDFLRVPGLDKVRARSLERYCATNYESLMDLLSQGLSWPVHSPMPREEALPLEGKTIVVTGRFDGIDRETLYQYLRSLGAGVATRVSKSTHAVIAGHNSTIIKLTTAKALTIPMQSLEDFIASRQLPSLELSSRSHP